MSGTGSNDRSHEPRPSRRRPARGFSLIELIITLLIGSILTAMAVPQVQSGVYYYRLRSAVAMATWAIQSTRFQALEEGYPYQVVFNKTGNTYQIQSEPSGAASFSNVGSAVPLSSSGTVLNQNTTLQFKPNGSVTAATGSLTFTITYQGSTETVTVSNYGNVSVTP